MHMMIHLQYVSQQDYDSMVIYHVYNMLYYVVIVVALRPLTLIMNLIEPAGELEFTL